MRGTRKDTMTILANATSFVIATALIVAAWAVYLWLNNLISKMPASWFREVLGGYIEFRAVGYDWSDTQLSRGSVRHGPAHDLSVVADLVRDTQNPASDSDIADDNRHIHNNLAQIRGNNSSLSAETARRRDYRSPHGNDNRVHRERPARSKPHCRALEYRRVPCRKPPRDCGNETG